jgi:hypothetical protein
MNREPAITWRSIGVGLTGVLLLCGLSPYNDFIVNNTFLVGNFLPIGLLLFFLMVVLLVNAPLHAWAPRWAMNRRELIVAMSMTLVACGLPGAGLMRYLPSQIVGLWNEGAKNPEYAAMLDEMALPDWMFPTYAGQTTAERGFDPITQNYFSRVPGVDDSFAARFAAVPWRVWARPTVAWTFFSFVMLGSFLCIVWIVRHQWTENERLLFPLATVYASVIEPPESGRAFNRLFRMPSFWIVFGAVFCVHSMEALNYYLPAYFPPIPMRYDLGAIFSNEPWVYVTGDLKTATLYFCVIGICYFLPLQISLSVWLFFILFQITLMIAGTYRTELNGAMQADQFFGALIPYAGSVIWIGRSQWKLIGRQMIRGWREGEPRGRYAPYALAGWTLVLLFTLGVAFLMVAGASAVGAITCMAALLTLHLCVARIVAETGMPFLNFYGNLDRPWLYLIDSQGHGIRTTNKSYLLTQMSASIYSSDIRESPAVYMSHAYRLGDRPGWRRTLPFTLCLLAALVVGFFTAGTAKLYTQYSHDITLDARAEPPDNYGNRQNIAENTLRRSYVYGYQGGPRENHSRLGHLAIGGTVSLGLILGRLSSASFPLHPVGFLLAYTWPVSKIWFSMFVGWVVKLLLTRFGGIELYRKARGVFLGLILGDAFVAAFWLIVSLVLNAMGLPYKGMFFLPP